MQHATGRVERPGESQEALDGKSSEIRLTPWFWFVCAICELTGFPGSDGEDGSGGWLLIFQGSTLNLRSYWFQSSGLELRFMPSSLEADGVKGYFLLHDESYMDAVIWSCGSWGEFISLLFTPYWYLHFQEVYFGPPGTALNRKDYRHNTSRPFGHSASANFITLAIAMFFVQKMSLPDWLWTSKGGVEMYIFCGRHPQYNVLHIYLHNDLVSLIWLTMRCPIVGYIHFCE